MKYVYIHGFNSGPDSRSRKEISRILDQPVFCFQNDYSKSFDECIEYMCKKIQEARGNEELCILGTSLGGFYAMQLRLPGITRVVAWNPVIFPSLQLERFIGKNVRFTDGVEWHFSRASLLSYAHAADSREWTNFYWRRMCDAFGHNIGSPALRTAIFGEHDEILNSELGKMFWQGHANVREIVSGHHIEDFSHITNIME